MEKEKETPVRNQLWEDAYGSVQFRNSAEMLLYFFVGSDRRI
jgi:hypothetical protein